MNGRKLSVNKACLFLAVLLLVAMGTVSAALYGLTQNITAVWYVVLFGIFVLLCAVCFMVLVRRKLAMFSDSFCTPTLGMTQKNQPKIRYTLDFDVTPHQLRHTYITNLLYAGVDPKTVQYLAGHENSKTTMDIYAKVKYNKPEELFGVVNGAFHQAIAE